MEGEGLVKLRDYASYIFDLDGTLFTVPVDWVRVREEVTKISGEPINNMPLFLKVEQLLSAHPSMRKPLFSMLDSHELKAAAVATPISGAVELLSSLSKVAKLGLVTMQGTAACDKILGRHRLGELFDTLVTREKSLDRAVQLGVALKSLGSAPAEALFTGDRLNDVVCAKRAGIEVVLIGGDPTADAKPNFAFPSLLELKDSIL